MPINPDNLPSNVATLRAMLAAQAAEMALQRTELAAARAASLPLLGGGGICGMTGKRVLYPHVLHRHRSFITVTRFLPY